MERRLKEVSLRPLKHRTDNNLGVFALRRCDETTRVVFGAGSFIEEAETVRPASGSCSVAKLLI